MSRAVRWAAWGCAVLAGHAAVNAALLRRPPATPAGHPGEVRVRRTAAGYPGAVPPPVSVVVPARDEAHRIGDCIASLVAQDVDCEILVLDDGSTDGTAEVARAAAAGDPRVRVLEGRPLPPGWLGKPHACQQLAEAAGGDVLVFVDADVRLAPGGLARTVALLDAAGLDLASPYPRQLADGLGLRLLQPLLQWSWLTFLPLRLAERGPVSMTAANGQLLAVRVPAYRAAGGHGAVRTEVIEDLALARAVKAAGGSAAVVDGTDVATCRMYADWAEARDGYRKSLWAAFGSRPGAAAAGALLAWLYLAPPAAAVSGLVRRRTDLVLSGAAGYGAAVAGRVVAARATGGRAGDALAHPASIVALLWLLAHSWWGRINGTLSWKGRAVGG
jgi:hypothetical protein